MNKIFAKFAFCAFIFLVLLKEIWYEKNHSMLFIEFLLNIEFFSSVKLRSYKNEKEYFMNIYKCRDESSFNVDQLSISFNNYEKLLRV